jgi:hypothetical protein
MPFIVQTATAKMPSRCKGQYRRVAVIEVKPGITEVAMISNHARGVVRVVETWERLHAQGVRTAYAKALVEAATMAALLNAQEAKP